MEISSLNFALDAVSSSSLTTVSGQASLAMLDNALEQTETSNKAMIRMMELSVNPAVGGNFDVSL